MHSVIWHDSRDLEYRRPFGAVPCDASVFLALDVEEAFAAAKVELRIWATTGGEKIYDPVCINDEGAYRRYVFELLVGKQPGLIWYHFNVWNSQGLSFFGAPPDGLEELAFPMIKCQQTGRSQL